MSGQADKTSTPTPWITNYTGNVWGDANNQEHDGDFPLLGNFYNAEDAKKCCEAVNSIRSHPPSSDLVGAAREVVEMSDAYGTALTDIENNGRDKDAKRRASQGLIFLFGAVRNLRAALSGVENGETEARHGK